MFLSRPSQPTANVPRCLLEVYSLSGPFVNTWLTQLTIRYKCKTVACFILEVPLPSFSRTLCFKIIQELHFSFFLLQVLPSELNITVLPLKIVNNYLIANSLCNDCRILFPFHCFLLKAQRRFLPAEILRSLVSSPRVAVVVH